MYLKKTTKPINKMLHTLALGLSVLFPKPWRLKYKYQRNMPPFYKYLELKALKVFLLFAVHIYTFFPNLFLSCIGISSLNLISLITELDF